MKRATLRSCARGVVLFAACGAAFHAGVKPVHAAAPHAHTYRVVDGDSLTAFVFVPAGHDRARPVPAILLFHGGGWAWGSPEWVFATAERFAGYGLVAIAVEYRLSQGGTTPVDALDDVCHAFAWTRAQAAALGVAGKVVGYGVSAGGHLVAAAATVGCGASNDLPDALLLWSPALDVANDGWFGKLLPEHATASDYAPLEHIGAATPPTCIVQGAEDTLTPLSGAQAFCARLTQVGGVCELNVYEGVGHLLTRNLANQESDFDPDPEKRADGIEKHRRFLAGLGLIAVE